MTKFIKFRERRWTGGVGWELCDVSVNVDYISVIRPSDTVHTFERWNIETNKKDIREEPCTTLVMYDDYSEITVLGSYKEVYSKINDKKPIYNIKRRGIK